MKRRIAEGFYVLLACTGIVLCMCEAADFTNQIYISIAGFAMIALAVLLIYLQDREEGWESL